MKAPRSSLTILLALCLAALMLAWVTIAQAKPVFTATEGGVTITIHDGACALSAVTLPYRATWDEAGKHYEGCVGAHPAGVLIFYWDDRSIVILAQSLFRRVAGI